MKRKSLLILALLIAALTSLFTSCSASVEPPKSEEVMAYVTFGNGGSRSLYTEYGITPYDSLFWDYDAVKMDGYGTTGAATKAPVSKDPSDNQIIGLSGTVGPLSQGAWEFTLYAYEAVNGAKSDNLVYQGKSDVVVLKGDETKAVPVSVELKGEKGTLNFTDAFFSWDEEGGTGDVYLRINIKGTADNSTAVDATRIAKVTNSDGYRIKSALNFGYGVNLFPAGYYTCTVQAYVEGDLNSTKTEVNSDSTYKASQSFGLRVYGNAITYIKGNLEESLFADVIFDVEKQEMKVFTPVAGAATTVPDITVTPLGESGKTTSVTFSSGALPAISVGETLQLDVRVTPLQSSNQKFEISGTTEDNKSAFAGIDLTLWKTGSNGSAQVSDFGTHTATVTTYIEKNLSNVSVHYKKTASDAADIKTNYAIETKAVEPDTVTIPEGKDGVYYQDTGKLVFVTTHFSEYYVLADCEAVITSANVGYATIHDAVAAAVEMSSQVDNTVTLTRHVNLSMDLKLGTGERGVSLNLNGKTINGGSYQVYTAGSGITTIFGDGVITNINSTQTADSAPLSIYAGSNVVLDGVSVIGNYCGVKNSGNLTIKKAKIEGTTFGLGCFGSGTTSIGVAGGNSSDVTITANEQALATAADTGLSDMVVNVYCGIFASTGIEWDDCPAYWASHGTLNVYGGTFTSESSGEVAAIYQKNGAVNIYDGIFRARNGVKLGAEAGDCTEITLNISGGIITGTRHAALYFKTTANGYNCNAYNINISGGEFTGSDAKGAISASIVQGVKIPTVQVTGGTFSSDPSEYLALDKMAVLRDGMYHIENDSRIKTEEQLKLAVEKGGEITLGAHIQLTESLKIAKDVTLNLGEYKINGKEKSSAIVLYAMEGPVKVTVIATEGGVIGTGSNGNCFDMPRYNEYSSELTINGGIYSSTSSSFLDIGNNNNDNRHDKLFINECLYTGYKIINVSQSNTKIVMTGGSLTGTGTGPGTCYGINFGTNSTNSTFTMTGGDITFESGSVIIGGASGNTIDISGTAKVTGKLSLKYSTMKITGGTVNITGNNTDNKALMISTGSTLNISGNAKVEGNPLFNMNGGTVNITGGSFSGNIVNGPNYGNSYLQSVEDLLPSDYLLSDSDSDGWYQVNSTN